MEKEGINYHDALIYLANKYGIKVEERELSDSERLEQSEREAKFVANEWAMKQMENNLHNVDEGRDVGLQYFIQRGLTDEAIRTFHLGYAIDSYDSLTNAAKTAGFDLEVLNSLGLIGKGNQGRFYDKFRGRVIFPIMNTAGKVIAFGGRDLKGGLAKYINSPESNIYKKSNELYGIHQAKNQIVKQDKCYLVEGYMDVIGMWQSGLENVVASSGTALTDGQIALIHRFTNNITLIYDGDAAGIKASLRGIDMLLSHKLDVKVLLLPDGHDPDSFARQHSPEEFRRFIKDNETDIIRFKTKVLLSDAGNDPQARTTAVRSIVASLACIPDQIKRNIYIQQCSLLMGIDETIIAGETEKHRISILERKRRERDYRDIDNIAPSPDPDGISATKTETDAINIDVGCSPLYPLEKEVIKYCVKYGMLDFCEIADDKGNISMLNVVDYVSDELSADDVKFSEPIFEKIFFLVKSLREKYIADAEKFYQKLLVRREKNLKTLTEQLIAKDLDMRSLEREEANIDKRLDAEIQHDFTEFAIQYTGRQLASHEDKKIRDIVMDIITDRHNLSKRYIQDSIDMEYYEKLGELLPRAITEWKHGILVEKRNSLIHQLTEATAAGDTEKQNILMKSIMDITRISSEIAKEIGDRVVAPK